MLQPHELLDKASQSKFHLWLLNRVLARVIPFNAPHRLQIQTVDAQSLAITLPYIRKNLNHLKGLHACALASLSEYCCGLTLIRHLDAKHYRLIMKELKMTYHYQGRTSAVARFSIPEAEINRIKEELKNTEAVFRSFSVETHDEQGNHLCTAEVTWQLKSWKAVKTA